MPMAHGSAARAWRRYDVSSLTAVVPRPFREHELRTQQHADANTAVLDDVEASAFGGEPGLFEEASFLGK